MVIHSAALTLVHVATIHPVLRETNGPGIHEVRRVVAAGYHSTRSGIAEATPSIDRVACPALRRHFARERESAAETYAASSTIQPLKYSPTVALERNWKYGRLVAAPAHFSAAVMLNALSTTIIFWHGKKRNDSSG